MFVFASKPNVVTPFLSQFPVVPSRDKHTYSFPSPGGLVGKTSVIYKSINSKFMSENNNLNNEKILTFCSSSFITSNIVLVTFVSFPV